MTIDIVDENIKLILGMIWTLILRFTIADIRYDQKNNFKEVWAVGHQQKRKLIFYFFSDVLSQGLN